MPTATEKELKIRPLGDRVVIRIDAEENQQTSGGIYIPDSAREKPQRGTVVAVGPGKMLESGNREEMSVVVGDKVLFAKYGGTDLKVESIEYKILNERDLLGIVD